MQSVSWEVMQRWGHRWVMASNTMNKPELVRGSKAISKEELVWIEEDRADVQLLPEETEMCSIPLQPLLPKVSLRLHEADGGAFVPHFPVQTPKGSN